MTDRHAARRDALRAGLAADGIDALCVTAPPNLLYLTGFTGDSTVLIVTKGRAIAVSDFRYEAQIVEQCPGLEYHIRPVARKLWDAVAEVASGLGLTNLAFEANGLLVADQLALAGALGTIPLRGEIGKVERLRAIKEEEEIAAIRRAIRAAERAFLMFKAGLDPGETEVDAAYTLEQCLHRCGSGRPPFDPIVAAGARAALPHARPTANAIGQSPFVLVDWGATWGGYGSDLTRMIATGNVGEEFLRAYAAVLGAQARAIAAIRPGVRARDVDAEARSSLDRAGYGDLFRHGLGHGLGLVIHEAPSVRPESEDVLLAGMVLTVEPGIYRPGWGGIRIEDDVLVTPEGCEVLTGLPKSIDSLSPP